MHIFSPFSATRARKWLALLILPALAAGCEQHPLEITERPLFDIGEPVVGMIVDANYNDLEQLQVQVDQSFELVGVGSGGYIPYQYQWRIGDEVIGRQYWLLFSFSVAGDYTITYAVTDSYGQTASDAVLIHVVRTTLNVAIDIKPGSDPNSINLGSNGTVPVAILGSVTFDATTVDPLTVTLAGADVAVRGRGTPMAAPADVNGDGFMDLVVHVATVALRLTAGDTEAVLQGRTFDGTEIEGRDFIRVVP